MLSMKEDDVSDVTGAPKKAAKRAAVSEEDAALLAQQAAEEPAEGVSLEEAVEQVPELAEPALPVDELPPGVAALIAAQQESTRLLIESLAEKIAGQAGREVNLVGNAESLIAQLAGTVSDGGDGDDPLPEPVTFISRGANFKAVRKPRHRGVGVDGQPFFTTGVAADFAPMGQFSTRNPDMAEWLRSRPGFNVDFWQLGAEPFSAPDPKTVLEKVIDATLALDDAMLEELEREEKASHKRKVVLDAIASARNRVQRFAAGV